MTQSGVSGATAGSGATIAQALTATGNASGTATYTITPSSNGCNGTPVNVVITVNPIPTVAAISNQTVCYNSTTAAVNFTGAVAGTVYNWTNDTPSIGLAASGSGTIAAFTAANTGLSPVTATITVTPEYTNAGQTCNGTPQTFTITVNPDPTVNQPTDVVVCNGLATSAINFTTTNSGGIQSYTWTNDNTSIGLAASGSVNITAFTAVNLGTTAAVANITVTPHFTNGGITCDGPAKTFTITVNPTPLAIATPSSSSICSGDATSIALTSNIPGTTFTWTISQSPAGSITGASAGNGDIIAQTLTNTTASNATLTYTVTPTNNGCTGTPVLVAITVKPMPVLSSSLTPPAICSGTTFNYAPNSLTAGTTFSWTRAAMA